MTTKKPAPAPSLLGWLGPAWTVGVGIVSFIIAAVTFYVTTKGTLDQHNSAIVDLTRVLKEESQARVSLENREAEKREALRREYITLMEKQTNSLTGVGDKINAISTKVEVMNSQYNTVSERLNKVLDQTAPGSTPARRGR